MINLDSENQDSTVELKDTGEIELPQIDVSKYIGKKAKIEQVTEHTGQYGFYIKIQTVVLDTIEGGKEPIALRASRVFGLQEDAEGKIGWGKDTNLGVFLKKKNVKHYKDLVGLEVVVQTQTSKKNQKDYLSFN
ncbi:MAG TPA: hypothetical protein VMW25_06310 [Clostridia bacterium]|nr:hypothetical protein [Clostridia bacterium]